MILIPPLQITAAQLVYSNVPENDAPLWDDEATYDTGDDVIYNHRVYRSLADSNTDQPDTGAAASPKTWQDRGATNRHRMFDLLSNARTRRAGLLEVVVRPGERVNGLSLVLVSAFAFECTVAPYGEDAVYTEQGDLQEAAHIDNAYDYFYAPREPLTRITLADLPMLSDPVITLRLTGEQIEIGEMLVGLQRDIAGTMRGTDVRFKSFSRREEDDFGNFTIVPRPFSDRVTYPLAVESPEIPRFKRQLSLRRDKPTLYLPAPHLEGLAVFGFPLDFNVVRGNPVVSNAQLKVAGLAEDQEDPVLGDLESVPPNIAVPIDGEPFTENSVFEIDAYAAVGGEDTHDTTDWRVSTDEAGTNVVLESLLDATNLTAWPLPGGHGLVEGNTYYVAVQRRGVISGPSGYSQPHAFTFAAAATIDTPSLTNPADGATMLTTGAFTASAFATTPAGFDTRQHVRLQIASDAGFSTLVLDETSADGSFSFPLDTLDDDTTYYARVKDVGHLLPESDWSAGISFTVAEPAGQQAYTSAGTYTFTVPDGVRRLSPVLVGPGGETTGIVWTQNGTQPGTGVPVYEVTSSRSPAGGGLRYHTGIAVTPGEDLTVVIGGSGDTQLKRGASILLFAGKGGAQNNVGAGTSIGGAVGGGNGAPGTTSTDPVFARAGGAAGYSDDGNTELGGSAASGTSNTGGDPASADKHGGGVGLLGEGASGTKWTGEPGSGGDDGSAGGEYGGARVYYSSSNSSQPGSVDASAPGAARLVWGTGRAYPDSANVGDV